jgi:hypothetical protein
MTGIPSRDRSGAQHELHVVDHPSDRVTIYDAERVRIMEPRDAIQLAAALIGRQSDRRRSD